MDNLRIDAYSNKADKYAKYRWSYAPLAIRCILDITHISAQSRVADVGSGTGILAEPFAQIVDRVFAVEPNLPMRQLAVRMLGHYPAFCSVDGCAEATTLPRESVDLILVGQALHWFDPQAARSEFLRILKPGGWLAVVWNHGTSERLDQALRDIFVPENGWDVSRGPSMTDLVRSYLGETGVVAESYPQSEVQSWETFIGAICSNSHAPDEEHPLYLNLIQAARAVFDALSVDGRLTSTFSTELRLGQLNP
jgi:SAM-dependent methyltransferase